MVDWIPVVSQIKSLFQLIFGDARGALKTQDNFVSKCPVVAHFVALEAYVLARVCSHPCVERDCIEFAKRCLKGGTRTACTIVDFVPLIGHIKGLLCHLFKDEDGAYRSLICASRTLLVLCFASAAGILAGPAVACFFACAIGVALDGVHAVSRGLESGQVGVWVLSENWDLGKCFDATIWFLSDAISGFAAYEIIHKLLMSILIAIASSQVVMFVFPRMVLTPFLGYDELFR